MTGARDGATAMQGSCFIARCCGYYSPSISFCLKLLIRTRDGKFWRRRGKVARGAKSCSANRNRNRNRNRPVCWASDGKRSVLHCALSLAVEPSNLPCTFHQKPVGSGGNRCCRDRSAACISMSLDDAESEGDVRWHDAVAVCRFTKAVSYWDLWRGEGRGGEGRRREAGDR